MLVDAENLSMPSSSSPANAGLVWKKIWKVQVPNKIRHFIWCAAKDSLATKRNLQARHIPIGEVCDGCGDQTESILHCFWLCDQARSVWMSNLGFSFLVQTKCRTFFELLKVIFSAGSSFRIALFAMAWCSVAIGCRNFTLHGRYMNWGTQQECWLQSIGMCIHRSSASPIVIHRCVGLLYLKIATKLTLVQLFLKDWVQQELVLYIVIIQGRSLQHYVRILARFSQLKWLKLWQLEAQLFLQGS